MRKESVREKSRSRLTLGENRKVNGECAGTNVNKKNDEEITDS